MLALATGACLTGCPAALIGILGNLNFTRRNEIRIRGEVDPKGRPSGTIKVGVVRFFEGSDATGTYKLPSSDVLEFDPKVPISPTGAGDATGSNKGEFALVLKSDQKIAQFLLLAWYDSDKSGKIERNEERAPETYQVTKMDTAFFGTRASGSSLAPVATTGVVTFGEAEKVRYRFVFPAAEEPPAANPEP